MEAIFVAIVPQLHDSEVVKKHYNNEGLLEIAAMHYKDKNDLKVLTKVTVRTKITQKYHQNTMRMKTTQKCQQVIVRMETV